MLGFSEVLFHFSKLVFSLQISVLYIGELVTHKDTTKLVSTEYLSPIILLSSLGFFAAGLILIYRISRWTCMKGKQRMPVADVELVKTANASPVQDRGHLMGLKCSSQVSLSKQPHRSSSDNIDVQSSKSAGKKLVKSTASNEVAKRDGEDVPRSEYTPLGKQASAGPADQLVVEKGNPAVAAKSPNPGTLVPEDPSQTPKKLGFLYCHTYALSFSVLAFTGTFGFIQLSNRESYVLWRISVFALAVHCVCFLLFGVATSAQLKDYLLTKSYSWSRIDAKVGATAGLYNRTGENHMYGKQKHGEDPNNSMNPIIEERENCEQDELPFPKMQRLQMRSEELSCSNSNNLQRQHPERGFEDELNPETPRSIMSSIQSLKSAQEQGEDSERGAGTSFVRRPVFMFEQQKLHNQEQIRQHDLATELEDQKSSSGSAEEHQGSQDSQSKTDKNDLGQKLFNAGRKRMKGSISSSLKEREDLFETKDDQSLNHDCSYHIASEPDREISGPSPILFYFLLLGASEEEEQLIPLQDVAYDRGLELKQSYLISEDLRIVGSESLCVDCNQNRPTAISIPCAHGGLCLRCNIKRANKFKQCLYCSKVVKPLTSDDRVYY